MLIERLAVIGVGLIGGSLARALRAGGHVGEVVGFGRSLANLQTAVSMKVIDRGEVSAADAVREADMVVVAVPVGSMEPIFAEIGLMMAKDAVLTDVGSVKTSVTQAARRALGNRFPDFVPAHPIAGAERSGVAASRMELFQGQRVVLTPEDETRAPALARVRDMWQAVGAEVMVLPAEQHDEILAACSHLPHVLAYALVDMLVRRDDHRATFELAAGGFRDFTRIASSDPVMWRDICLANRDAILRVLQEYRGNLDLFIDALHREDGDLLLEAFSRAKHARDTALSKPKDSGLETKD